MVGAELPGLEVKDIRVSTEEKVLTIKGEKKREEQERLACKVIKSKRPSRMAS